MSKNKNRKFDNAFAVESVDAFGGLDSTGLFGRLSTPSVMTNFRLNSDGSIEKRCGYSLAASLPAPIDAVFPDGELSWRLYILAGGSVYLADTSVGDYTKLGEAAQSGDGCFFRLGKDIFLTAGDEIYSVLPDGIFRTEAYVPLYGSEWSEDGGEVFEPINLLSRSVRLNYILTSESSVLHTRLDALSIDEILVGGVPLRGAILDGQVIRLPAAFPAGSEIDVRLTLPTIGEPDESELLLSCRHAATLGVGKDAVACLFDGEEPDRVFMSRPTDGSELYFPAESAYISDIPGGVSAVAGRPDRFMIFGTNEAHLVSGDSETCISYSFGCLSPDAIVCADDRIYTADRCGVHEWKTDGSRPALISEPVDGNVSREFFSRAVLGFDPSRGELHVSDPLDNDGKTLVFNIGRRAWYLFDGIGAEKYFSAGESFGFAACSGIFLFCDDKSVDITLGGEEREIVAHYVSRYSDLECPNDAKRLRRLQLCASDDGAFELNISDAIGKLCSVDIEGQGQGEPTMHTFPIASARTRFVRCEITAPGAKRQHIFGLTLSAVK